VGQFPLILKKCLIAVVSNLPVMNLSLRTRFYLSGVIGLNAALKLLQKGASVLLVERGKELCTGATGAGQGYLWMAHRYSRCTEA